MKIHIFILLFLSSFSFSQGLELSEIMKGDEFIGYQPGSAEWKADGSGFIFSKQISFNESKSFEYSLSTKKVAEISDEAEEEVVYAIDETQGGFYTKGGNLYHYDAKTNKSKSILYTNDYISDFNYNSDTKKLTYRVSNSIYSYCTETGSIKQLVEFKKGEKPSDSKSANTFLTRQQEELFEYLEITKRKDENEVELPKIINVYIGSTTVRNVTLSNDSKTLLYTLVKSPDRKPTQYMEFITKEGYATPKNARSKVGTEDPVFEVHALNMNSQESTKLDFSALSGIKMKADFLSEFYNETGDLETPKSCFINGPYLSSKNNIAVYELKSTDNKDRWIVGIDLKDNSVVEYEHLHDKAWIGGPLVTGWNMVPGKVEWHANGETFYFSSEKSGYEHIYSCDVNTKKITQMTSGNWEVHDFYFSTKDENKLYVSANKTHPGNRDFYNLNVNSKELTPLLTADGNHDVVVSPDEKQLAVRYSYKNKPWELYIASNKANTTLSQITDSQSEKFNNYNWIAPEIVTFKAQDGTNVNARIYEPKADNNTGAAVIFVHGAGYLQNAHNWWSGYHREYMFHNFLTEQGYTVLDIDYRASKGYGRDFRTGIYRHMGGKDLSDQIDGKKFLMKKYGVAEDKVGIYGGSYGGFITLMALLTEPGEFQCGAAIRSVTDWAHYNHAYTSNILNTPEEDSIAYRQSSPIYFADNLEDELIMLHGMVDDNVQFEDVVRLSQRFIELGKEDWELAVYPVEPHGFKITSSWVDEYSRIFKLFERNLK